MMRRVLVPLVLVAGIGALSPCAAHPLGNFSVNRLSDVRVDSTGLHVTYVVDLAEIPSYEEMRALDANDDDAVTPSEEQQYLATLIPSLTRNLHARADGARLRLGPGRGHVTVREGQGGLPCIRIELPLTAACDWPARVRYSDANYANHVGWADVVRARAGARLTASDAPSRDVSAGLTTYPTDALTSPAARTEATFAIEAVAAPRVATPRAPAPTRVAAVSAPRPQPAPTTRDRFAALIAQRTLSVPVLLVSLLIALTLGAVHALSPGHGKTIVGAYLVGSRGTARHALFLGLVVTLTHTIGVYALGLVTLFASRYIVPERLYPWLGFGSGMMVALIGGMLFHERVERLIGRTRAHRHLFFRHGRDDAEHAHSPADASGAITWRSLLALGVSGGMVPCPSAIVVLLSAIALHRVGFGLLLIVAFSIGLAAVLVALGMVAVYSAQYLRRFGDGGWAMRAAPVGSAAVVTALGVIIAVQALVAGGILRLPT